MGQWMDWWVGGCTGWVGVWRGVHIGGLVDRVDRCTGWMDGWTGGLIAAQCSVGCAGRWDNGYGRWMHGGLVGSCRWDDG